MKMESIKKTGLRDTLTGANVWTFFESGFRQTVKKFLRHSTIFY